VLLFFASEAADELAPSIPNQAPFSHFDRIESSRQILTISIEDRNMDGLRDFLKLSKY
jgi:hypothetical protein